MKKSDRFEGMQPFFMFKKNERFIQGRAFWTGDQEVNVVFLVLVLGLFILLLSGGTWGFWVGGIAGIGNQVLVLAVISFVGFLSVIYGLKFRSNLKLNQAGKLIIGNVTEYKTLDGDIVSIRISYEFKNENGTTIFGKSESPLSYSSHRETGISIDMPVVVQYLNDSEHSLL